MMMTNSSDVDYDKRIKDTVAWFNALVSRERVLTYLSEVGSYPDLGNPGEIKPFAKHFRLSPSMAAVRLTMTYFGLDRSDAERNAPEYGEDE